MFTYAAESPLWTDKGTFWVAVVAAGLSLIAIGVSIWSGISGHRSANHAETSAAAAKDAAVSAQASARAAEKSADADGKVAQVELDRDHERYRPTPTIERFVEENDAGRGRAVYFELSTPRTYRVTGEAIIRDGLEGFLETTPGHLVQPSRLTRFNVTSTSGHPIPERIRLHFWPPTVTDPGEAWTCRCGKNDKDGVDGAHWLWTIEVPAEFR